MAEFRWGIDYTPNMIPETALEIDYKMFEHRNKMSLIMEKDNKYLESIKSLINVINSDKEEDAEIAKVELNSMLP